MRVNNRTQEFYSTVESMMSRRPFGESYRLMNNENSETQFYKIAKEIGKENLDTIQKLQKLSELVKQNSILDDKLPEITQLIHASKVNISKMSSEINGFQKAFKDKKIKYIFNRNSLEHANNVFTSLQTKIANTSNEFKEILELRTKIMREQKLRKEQYGSTSINNSSTHSSPLMFNSKVISKITTPLSRSLTSSPAPQQPQQQQQQQPSQPHQISVSTSFNPNQQNNNAMFSPSPLQNSSITTSPILASPSAAIYQQQQSNTNSFISPIQRPPSQNSNASSYISSTTPLIPKVPGIQNQNNLASTTSSTTSITNNNLQNNNINNINNNNNNGININNFSSNNNGNGSIGINSSIQSIDSNNYLNPFSTTKQQPSSPFMYNDRTTTQGIAISNSINYGASGGTAEQRRNVASTNNRMYSSDDSMVISMDSIIDDDRNNGKDKSKSSTSTSYQQQQQMYSSYPQEYLESRSSAIDSIESTIAELGQIYQNFTQILAGQRETVQRIDDNIADVEMNVTGAQNYLMKYYKSISSNRWLIIKILFVVLVFFFIFVVFL